MVQARLIRKGQVTIPKQIRDYLHLNTGSQVDFVIDENGDVKVIPLNVAVGSLSSILHRKDMTASSLEDMEQAIIEGASDRT